MKQYLKEKSPFIFGIYRRICRLRTELYLHKIRKWPLHKVFEDAYRGMVHLESASGSGSTLKATEKIRQEIPILFGQLRIRSMVDAPCGDFNWMKEVPLTIEQYYGFDIGPELIQMNNKNHGNSIRKFMIIDITKDELPEVDMVFCRDCLVHLSFDNIISVIRNFKKSGSTYLLTTTFPNIKKNKNIITGDWRPINLEQSPFNFPKPLDLINEHYWEDNKKTGKSIGLWRLEDIIV